MRLPKINNAIQSINAAALLLGAASLLSRILGIFRDRMLAGHFGASRELDIYYAAFQIPDFLFNVFLLGAASAAIIPVFLEVRKKSEEEARNLMGNLINIFVACVLGISVLILLLMPLLIELLTPGFSAAESRATVTLARIMMASPILLGLSGILSAVTQSFRRFLIFALSPIVYNLGIILGIIFFLPILGLPGLAWGVVLGAFMHFFVQFSSFAQLGFKIMPSLSCSFTPSLKKIIKLSFPRVIAASINNVTAVFLVAISSTLIGGSIAIYQFANNLGGLPIGIFGVSFAIAAFPALSENFMQKDAKVFFKTFYSSILSILLWVFPLSVFFYVLRAQIVRVTLGVGRFDWNDTRLTAAALGIMTLAIFANSLIPILIRFFYAVGNTVRPLLINISTAVLTIILAFFFINVLSENNYFTQTLTAFLRVEDIENVVVLGVILAISIGSLVDLLFLSVAAQKEARLKFASTGEIIPGMPWKEVFKMFAASIVTGFISYELLRIVNLFIGLDTFIGVLIQGGTAFLTGLAIYTLILYKWGNEEMVALMHIIRKKMVKFRFLPRELDGGLS